MPYSHGSGEYTTNFKRSPNERLYSDQIPAHEKIQHQISKKIRQWTSKAKATATANENAS